MSPVVVPALTPVASLAALVQQAVDVLIATVRKHTQGGTDRCCVLGLSGGSSPGPVYTALSTALVELIKADELDAAVLKRVYFFIVDDRVIEPSQTTSNINLVQRTLLTPLLEGLTGLFGAEKAGELFDGASQLVAPRPLDPATGALRAVDDIVECYNKRVSALLTEHGAPALCIMGLGPDGHTASLFPPLKGAAAQVEDKAGTAPAVIHTTTERFDVFHRMTLTLPVLATAGQLLFLLKGAGKRDVWAEMVEETSTGAANHTRWPVAGLSVNGGSNIVALYCE